MKTWRAAARVAFLAAGVAAIGGAARAAEPPRERLTLHPSETIWTGEAPLELCAVGRALRVSTVPPSGRHGAFKRSGTLVAEIIAPAPMAVRVTRTARLCAERAAAGWAPSVLLAPDRAAAAPFADRLNACLLSADAARYVGRLTFWLDSGCDL